MSKKLCGTKLRGQIARETDRRVSQEPNHSRTHTIAIHNLDSISETKPKIKWPKSTEKAKYKKFDDKVNNLLRSQKGTVKERLKNWHR